MAVHVRHRPEVAAVARRHDFSVKNLLDDGPAVTASILDKQEFECL